MSALMRLTNPNLRRLAQITMKNCRLVSTTPNKKGDMYGMEPDQTRKWEYVKDKKNWVSFGYDRTDQEYDKSAMNATFFVTITLCLVVGSFYYAYLPDSGLRDWAQREAYLQLRRREAAGLEPISRDYIDPASVELPSDEELGDAEIII